MPSASKTVRLFSFVLNNTNLVTCPEKVVEYSSAKKLSNTLLFSFCKPILKVGKAVFADARQGQKKYLC